MRDPTMVAAAPDESRYRGVADLLRAHAERAPDKVFLHSIDQNSEITWGELYRLSNRFSRFLSDHGIGVNDRVLALTDNSLENLILYYAVQSHGATFCTINVETNAADLERLIARLQPKMVLWDRALEMEALRAGAPGEWIPFGGLGSDSGLFAMLDDYPDSPAPDRAAGPEDISVISFTSGTSAAPKSVMHSFGNYFWIAEQTLQMWGLTEADRVLEYRSFSWASSHMLSLMPCLVSGATLIFARRFSRGRFFEWIRDFKPTIAVGVPTVVNMLLERSSEARELDFASLRFMSCSTAPLMVEQHRLFEETYGIKLIQLCGMSEGGIVAGNPWHTPRIGSVGLPGLYQNLKIVDTEGRALPPGEVGEIEIGGAQNAFGYLLEDGGLEPVRGLRLKTGDLGYLDDDGYLYITGRAKELIIRGGVNISPLEIDNVLARHPDIAEAATIGVPGGVYGEEVVSYVARRTGRALDEDAVLAHCGQSLADFKLPRRIVFVDEILKNQRGKVDRNALLERWKNADSTTHAIE